MIRRLSAHDKAEWMLKATLGDQGTAEVVEVPTPVTVSAVKAPKEKKKSREKVAKPAPMKTVAVQTPILPTAVAKKPEKKKGRVAMG